MRMGDARTWSLRRLWQIAELDFLTLGNRAGHGVNRCTASFDAVLACDALSLGIRHVRFGTKLMSKRSTTSLGIHKFKMNPWVLLNAYLLEQSAVKSIE